MIKYNNSNINDWYYDTSNIIKVYRNNAVCYYKISDTPPTPPTPTSKWLATYVGGTTSSAECDSTSAITNGEITLSNLVSVEIGDCVTSIGEGAFYICSTLSRVTIPDSVTSIGMGAFNSCTSLTSITIPDSVTSIGDGVFGSCGLTSINIPSGVTSIGSGAFFYCNSLTSITVNATTPPTLGSSVFDNTNNCPIYVPCESVEAYKSASGWSSYASRITCAQPTFQGKWLATYVGGTTSSAECDPSSAITNGEITLSNLASVEIGDCVTNIYAFSFDSCTSLTSCTIGSGVTSIGNHAFYECSGLTSITIPSGVTSIGDYVFNGCTSLTNVTIGSGVTSIGNSAFNSCTSLTSITIPDSVTSIAEFAFESCTSLTSCTIGSGVTSIGDFAFVDCSGLTSITIFATTPPTLGNPMVFINTNDCPIYVPSGSVSAYQSAWSDYASRIQAIPNS